VTYRSPRAAPALVVVLSRSIRVAGRGGGECCRRAWRVWAARRAARIQIVAVKARPANPREMDQAPRTGGRIRRATMAPTARARVVRRHASAVRSGCSPGSNRVLLIE
jgi:hypothetical protein